ncbi:galanin receptor type 1 [Lingula anatina]|uniref:Galanin receptor type 1 n=1 Tax=Lingula anatina TaxID=7574 RepID=A0A1S3ILA8_LINAN|nr:galanin receptor type 1-like [Lingula anatina]XP_013410368.1 galanin receptor type 1 [Lingula anatina]|eukprot:XP_013398304.1 galanin receptor type 1-like [Lingula anatina]
MAVVDSLTNSTAVYNDTGFTAVYNDTGFTAVYNDTGLYCHVLEMGFTRVGIPLLLSLISLLGLAGNVLVIYVISRNKRMNALFFNLALADLFFIIVCVPVQITNYASANRVALGPVICKISYYVTYFTMALSIYSLVAICVLRYVGIKHPLHARKLLRRRNVILASSVIWVFTLVLNIPVAFFYNETSTSLCSVSTGEQWQYYVYVSLTSGFDFVIPFILVSTLSTLIIVTIRKDLTEREELHLETEEQLQQSKKNTKRLIVLVILVTVVFFVCNGPLNLTLILVGMGAVSFTCDPVDGIPIILIQVLAISNASLNPLIFNFASKEFRKEFAKALSFRSKKRTTDSMALTGCGGNKNGTKCTLRDSQ